MQHYCYCTQTIFLFPAVAPRRMEAELQEQVESLQKALAEKDVHLRMAAG
jgi:hypothetical protein